ncbi:MAG: hypothetical protein R3C45_08120, partial [Phycisphaerales bacterium]
MRLFPNVFLCLMLSVFYCPNAIYAAITYDTVALSGEDAPGTTAGVIFSSFSGSPVLNDLGQTAFNGFLAGTGVNTFNDSGIFSDSTGTLSLVAREGVAAPGTAAGVRFLSLGSPVLNDAGQTAFLGTLTGTGVSISNNEGIFSEAGGSLGLVARAGSPAPGLGAGVNFVSDFGNPLLNNSGRTAFYNGLAGTGVDSTNNKGIFSEAGGTLGLVARAANPAPGTGAGVTFSVFGTPDSPVMNDAGQTAFLAVLTGTGVNSTNDRGIFSEAGGSLGLVARSGDPAPDTVAGVNFGFVYAPVINDLGQTAFIGALTGTGIDITNNEGIFSEAGGTLGLVARAGNPAPGTGADVNFNGFFNPVLNNAGQTAFMCSLTGAGVQLTNNSGIFSEAGGTLGLVAREGDPAPGAGAGVVFNSFSSGTNLPAFNDAGQTAFIGDLTGTGVNSTNDRGIFATDLAGTLHLIAREGDLFDVNPDPLIADNRTISLLNFVGNSGGSDGRATGLNNAGQLVFRLVFTDGTQGVFVASIESAIPGDLDGDGFVGINDLNLVLGNWNQTVPPADARADTNGDNFIGIADLNTVLGNWNAGTPPTDSANI